MAVALNRKGGVTVAITDLRDADGHRAQLLQTLTAALVYAIERHGEIAIPRTWFDGSPLPVLCIQQDAPADTMRFTLVDPAALRSSPTSPAPRQS